MKIGREGQRALRPVEDDQLIFQRLAKAIPSTGFVFVISMFSSKLVANLAQVFQLC
jgi:hypothetical protein